MPATPLSLTLPLPPSANDYWRHNRGIIHKSQDAKKYIALVHGEMLGRGVKPFAGSVSVSLDVYFKTRASDLDNILKILFDSFNKTVWDDDKHVVEIHARRFDAPQGTTKAAKAARAEWKPRVEVTVSPIYQEGQK